MGMGLDQMPVRKSMGDNIPFRYGGKSVIRQDTLATLKLGAQGFPDTEYQPSLMDKEDNAMYKMDMNMFPDLVSENNLVPQSEYPDRYQHIPNMLKRHTNSFEPTGTPGRKTITTKNMQNPRDIIVDDFI
jgi:hypothetical protein